MNENDANLINAIDFINETKEKEEENAKPQPGDYHYRETFFAYQDFAGAGIVVLAVALVQFIDIYWIGVV